MGAFASTEAPSEKQPPARYMIPTSEIEDAEMRKTALGTTDITLPDKIEIQDILDKDPAAMQQLVDTLKERGYALLNIGPERRSYINKVTDIASKFFELDFDKKNINLDPEGMNVGYVHNKIREYIKYRPCDPEALRPKEPEQLVSTYIDAYQV